MENNTDNIFCIRLFDFLSSSSLSYCVLRNYQNLPENTGGSDLDIWVSEEDYDSFMKLLGEASEWAECPLVSYIPDNHCPKLCFMGLGCGIQIDVFKGDIYCQGRVLIPQNVILNHIEDYRGIAILNDAFADLLAFLKEIINNGNCQEKYIDALFSHHNIYGKDYLKDNLSSFSDEFLDFFHNCIGNRATLKNSMSALSRYARKTLGIKPSFFSKLKKVRRLLLPPGYVIALIGTDGSGKSTIIDSITPILNEAFHNGVEYYHLRPHWLPDIGVLLGKRDEEEGGIASNPHGAEPSGLMMSLIRWCYYLLDYSFGYFRKIWFVKHTKAHVALFDRYYYDYYIDPHRLGVRLPKWIVRAGECIVPKPDIILCLGGKPELIYERKPETSFEEVKRQMAEMRLFCAYHHRAVWIDTTQTVEQSVKDAMVAIQGCMAKRFEKVVLK